MASCRLLELSLGYSFSAFVPGLHGTECTILPSLYDVEYTGIPREPTSAAAVFLLAYGHIVKDDESRIFFNTTSRDGGRHNILRGMGL